MTYRKTGNYSGLISFFGFAKRILMVGLIGGPINMLKNAVGKRRGRKSSK
jgi:hypothetical protein